MTNERPFKNQLYDQFERVGKALASRRRLELLDVLAQGERSVEDLGDETGMPVANASQHLQVLRRARFVETRQEGTHVFYRIADVRVFSLLQAVREVAKARLAEVDQITRDFRENRSHFEPIRMEELFERIRTDDVVVIDVRPPVEYASGHIIGARSIPIDELEARLGEIPADVDVVAYCRGPYCVFADEAVEKLRRHGRPARRLNLGFPDWKAAGLPVKVEGP
jgi:rhodanese-related sulfurtransferase